MILLAQFMIWGGAAMLLLSLAVQEFDHTPYFFGVSRALRMVFPVVITDEADPEMIQILDRFDGVGK